MNIKTRPADDLSVIARFMAKLLVSETHSWRGTPCMLWGAGRSRGGDRWSELAWYGTFNPGGVVVGGVRAHVYAAWLWGLIDDLRVPEDMNLDHRCHQSLCCNPLHLEVVPKEVNQQRKRNRMNPPVTEDEQRDTPMVREPSLTERLEALLGGGENRASERMWESLKEMTKDMPPVVFPVSTPRSPDDFMERTITGRVSHMPEGFGGWDMLDKTGGYKPGELAMIVIGMSADSGSAMRYHTMKSREPGPNCPVVVFDYEGGYADMEARMLAIMGEGGGVGVSTFTLDSLPREMGIDLASGPDRTGVSVVRDGRLMDHYKVDPGDMRLERAHEMEMRMMVRDEMPRLLKDQTFNDGTPRSPKQTRKAMGRGKQKGKFAGRRR